MALRSAGKYVRARWVGEKNTFSPTQSLTRLQSSSNGRIAPPPSHPHAAASAAPPPASPNRTNARQPTLGVWAPRRLPLWVSVMTGETAPVRPGDHGPLGPGTDAEHERYVGDGDR